MYELLGIYDIIYSIFTKRNTIDCEEDILKNMVEKNKNEVFSFALIGNMIHFAYGGLSDAAIKKINSINGPVFRTHTRLRIGTVIVRTWHDVKYEVRVCKEGFEWNGQIYSSLSAVARMITGTNRNGFTFFGIRDKIND